VKVCLLRLSTIESSDFIPNDISEVRRQVIFVPVSELYFSYAGFHRKIHSSVSSLDQVTDKPTVFLSIRHIAIFRWVNPLIDNERSAYIDGDYQDRIK
jgi:hypothetical protein